MKLWKGNIANQGWEISNLEVAQRFVYALRYKKDLAELREYRGLDYALINFISDKEGLNSSWEWDEDKGSIQGSEDILEIISLALNLEKEIEVKA